MFLRRILACGLLVGTVGCGWALAFAAAGPGIVPAAYTGPERIDLSGMWDFRLDQAKQGETQTWFAGNEAGGWTPLAVPGSFNEQLAKDAGSPEKSDTMRFYQGIAWYRTSFVSPVEVSGESTKRCFLHLSGTVLRHTVWVNGQKVGTGTRPYLEESYDVTMALQKDGRNTLVVEVDNTIPERGIPDTGWTGWWDDGGLIRPVYLEIRAATYGQSYSTTTMDRKGGWKLDVDTIVHRSDLRGKAEVGYMLTDAESKVIWKQPAMPVAFAGADGEVKSVAAVVGVRAWAPEHPALYTLSTTVQAGGHADVTSVRIGFRQIETRGTQILLNGEPVTIRGITRHQFLAGAGMSLSVAQDRTDIADLKALGANFVRLAHYTQSQDVFNACDELGLMVWTEIPAWHSKVASLSDPVVWGEYAQPQLQGMVEQHRNHPSVVVWSVANEISSEDPSTAAYVAKAIAYVKSLDHSRLVAFASDKRERDLAYGAVDVIAINEYFGWYYGKLDDVGPMLDSVHAKFPDKPLMVSEYGAEAVGGWSQSMGKPDSRDYSYSGQVTFLQRHMEQIYAPERRGFVAGGVVWVYNDFPDPHRIGGDHPDMAKYRNNKGIVTMDRIHKPTYDTVKNFFRKVKAEGTAK